MPDIFDQIAPESNTPVKGDIFDQISLEPEQKTSRYQKFKKGEEKLRQAIVEPGARVVKGMAKGFAQLPRTITTLPLHLLNLIPGLNKIPGTEGQSALETALSYLDQPTLYETALQKHLEEKLPEATTPLGQSLEAGGTTLANLLGFGIAPQTALPAAAGGQFGRNLYDLLTEQLGITPGETGAQLSEFAGELPAYLSGAFPAMAKKAVTAESGLTLPKVVKREGKEFGFFKPKVFSGEKQKAMEKVTKQSEKLVDNIRKQSIPIAKEIEQGIDVAARNENNFQKVSQIASKIPEKYESSFVNDYLDLVKEHIDEVPIPTDEQESIIKLVNKYSSKFGELEGGKRFYTPKEYLDQFRNINDDIKSLYQTKFVYGDRLPTMRFYEGLKDSIAKTFESNAPKEFSDLFKETNKEYSSLKKLDKFNEIINSFSNEEGSLIPKKLDSYLSTPRKLKVLQKQVGEEGIQKLKTISKDLNKAAKNLDLIEENKLSSLVTSHLGVGILKWLGIPLVVPLKVGKNLIEYSRGYALTRPQAQKDVQNLLKAVRSGSLKATKSMLIKLDEHAQKYEFENPLESKEGSPDLSNNLTEASGSQSQ